MTLIEKTTRMAGRLGDRLLGSLVPAISAHASDQWYEDCSCSCHTICQRSCTLFQSGRIVCGPCNLNCRYTAGCSSC
jgi:hypothetical protein